MRKRDRCIWEKETYLYEKMRTMYMRKGIHLYELRSFAKKSETFIYMRKRDVCIWEKETYVYGKKRPMYMGKRDLCI